MSKLGERILILQNYGIWHYAENGGPGAFGHTARNLAVIMPILYDIHDFASDAWLIDFTTYRIHNLEFKSKNLPSGFDTISE